MIRQDKRKCTLEGKPSLLINEVANLVLNVAATVCEHAKVPEEEVLTQIQQAIQLNVLIKSGMDIEEALNIADPKHTIREITSLEKDGSTTMLKEYGYEQ